MTASPDTTPEPLGLTMQRIAEDHLERCFDYLAKIEEAEGEFEHDDDDPGVAPFCGCNTCIVREVLAASWDLMCIAAQFDVEDKDAEALGAYAEDAVTDSLKLMADRLREEADVARSSARGRHPRIVANTQAAALRYAADVVEGKYPEVPSAAL
jgi:hypothetical protein